MNLTIMENQKGKMANINIQNQFVQPRKDRRKQKSLEDSKKIGLNEKAIRDLYVSILVKYNFYKRD